MEQGGSPIQVFISYSHDSSEHGQRVLVLAQQLRAHGVDAQIDQFVSGGPEEGWPRWMRRQIADAAFVLVVCTPTYLRRFDGTERSGQGLGVSWESIITQQELYEALGKNRKFIPVLFDDTLQESVPAILRPYSVYRLMQDYTELLRVLLNQPSVVPNKLASPVQLPGSSAAVQSVIANLPSLPLPMAQTLLRALNAKSAADIYLASQHFCHAMVFLCTASYAAFYIQLRPRVRDIDHQLESLQWMEPKPCVEFMAQLAELLSAHPEIGANTFFGPVYARLTTAFRLSDSSWMEDITEEPQQSSQSSITPLEVLRHVIQLGGMPKSATDLNAQRAVALRDSIIECYAHMQSFGECRLAVGAFRSGDPGGTTVYQYLSLHGDGLRIPLAVEEDITSRTNKQEGALWWIGRRRPLALFPFAVYEAGVAGQERVGFIHPAIARITATDGRLREVCKLAYLDYHSGDYLQRFDASYELAALFTALKGHTISPGEVQSIREVKSSASSQASSDHPIWLGDFELLEEIGRGAMGLVYKARQASLGRLVALKVLPPKFAADPLAIRRFALEVETLGRCDHPNIVKILTAGQVGESRYYAMEFIDGSDLAVLYSVLSKWKQTSREPLTEDHISAALSSRRVASWGDVEAISMQHSLPIEQSQPSASGKNYYTRIAELMCGAAFGVHHLHSSGVIHRDLKPGNLMVTADGQRTVVMDLGLAKAMDQESIAGSSQTKILGTLRYIAPEQLQRNMVEITPRVDIYGLGATLYELVCLHPIFDGDTEERLTTQILFSDPTPARSWAPEIPKALELIIQKATAKPPQARYNSAAELAEDLGSFARDGFTLHARMPSPLQRLRKYTVRHLSRVVVLVSLVLAIVSGLWLWDYNRIKTVAYASIVSRRHIPKGLHQLSRRDWKRMYVHSELLFQHRRILALRTVNSAGRLIDDSDGESEWRYYYRENGSLEKIEALNHNHIVQGVRRINEDATTDTLENRAGVAATLSEVSENGGRRATQIDRYVFEYDSHGWPISTKYQNRGGIPQPTTDGSYGVMNEFSADGLVVRTWKLAQDGSKKLQRNGILETKIEYDRWANPVRQCYFGENDHPASDQFGVSCEITQRNDVSNPRLYQNMGVDGNPVISTESGCASVALLYTPAGFIKEEQCLDQTGKPIPDAYGIPISAMENDERGNWLKRYVLGSDRKPTYSNQGISIKKGKFDDAGNDIDDSYFGIDGQPVYDEHGHHRVVSIYEHGLLVKYLQYDTAGHLTRASRFMPVSIFRYDKAGNILEIRFYGEDERPAVNEKGIHATLFEYDIGGNLTKESYLGADGNPVFSKECCAIISNKYDGRGNQIEQAFFGVNREPVLTKDGVHGGLRVFDEYGQEIKRSFFGINHELVLFQNAFSSYTLKYNEFGQIMEAAYFGLGEAPATENGVHRLQHTYDHRGNEREIAFFGVHNEPILSQDGYHNRKSNYDEWGHLTDERYYGIHSEPILNKSGIHHLKLTYDLRGNITEETYFDRSEHPCSNKEGYHRIVTAYDTRGYKIEQKVYGDNDQPIKDKSGKHREVSTYDDRGNEIEERFYDERGNLAAPGGVAITKILWDIRGNVLEVSFYGPDGRPSIQHANHPVNPFLEADSKRRSEVSRAQYTYDNANRRISEEFVGTNGKSIENIYGTARVEFTYASGRRIEKWFNLRGVSVPVQNLEPPSK